MKREKILKILEKYHVSYDIAFAIADKLQQRSKVSDEDAGEPIQNALYATNNFTTDQCNNLTDGILEYLKDAGFKIIR